MKQRALQIQIATGLPYVACKAQAKKEHILNSRGKQSKGRYVMVYEGGQQVAKKRSK